MEGVPRMPMLQIELKQNSIDFSSLDWAGMPSSEDYYESIQQQTADALKKHIRDEYGDNPDKFEGAINNLLEAQLAAYKAMPSPDFEGCTIIKKYFGQLHYMQSRFPFKGDGGLKVTFAWQDAFTGYLTENDSLEFEQTAILFNIGAIHSFLGAADSRISEEGIRISCVHFQCAAGIFTYLSENFDTTLSPDINQFMLKLFINLCLAQGQECLLEKSMQDNRKSSIVSKICQQVVDYYKQCLQSLENKDSNIVLGNSTHKAWKKLIYFKVQYYSAITKYFMGNSVLDLDKYGQSVSYFGAAVAHLNELTKLVKGFSKETKLKVDNALKFTTDVLNGKYNSAVKDNNYVYNDRVPDPATLPEAKGASLVKALPFEPAKEDITGPDFFAKLVPMEAHLAASTYSEEKAKLLRSVVERIDEKNAVIDQYKSSIELDPKKLIDPNHVMKLNVELIEKCALLNTDQTPISDLKEHMEVLNDVYSELDSVLNDILSIVEKEESDDLRLKDTAPKEAFSVQEDIEGIRRELSVYTELHQKADQMNTDLQTACRIHIQNMKVVATGIAGVEEDLKLKEMSQLIGEEDKNDIGLIRKLCNKVVEMEQQRKSLLEQLRQQMESDDVTSALVTKHGIDQDDLFKEELKKYDSLINTIDQNLAAQENIFDAVTEANARYTKIRKVVEAERDRIQQRSHNLVLSCTITPEVSSRCNDGKKFFGEILSKAKGLYDRVKEFQDENDERRREIYKKIEEKKKPPPRPSAPKPKLATPSEKKPDVASAKVPKPGMILSPEVLAKMMAEDDDELLNDPEFLLFLQNQGDMQHLVGDSMSPSLQQPLSMMSRPSPMPSPGNNVPSVAHLPRPTVSIPPGYIPSSVPPGPARSLTTSHPAVSQPYHPNSMALNRPPLNQVESYQADNHRPVVPPNVSQHLSHPGVTGQSNLPAPNIVASSHGIHGMSQPALQDNPSQMQKLPTGAPPPGMGSQYQQVTAAASQNLQYSSSAYQARAHEAQILPTQPVPPPAASHGGASQYQQINAPPHHNLQHPPASMYQSQTAHMQLPPAQPTSSQTTVLPQQEFPRPPVSTYPTPVGQVQVPPAQPPPSQGVASQQQQIYGQSQQNLPYSVPPHHTPAGIHHQPTQVLPVPQSSAQFQPNFSRHNIHAQPNRHMMQSTGFTPRPQHLSSERYHVGNVPPLSSRSVLNVPQTAMNHQAGYPSHQTSTHQLTIGNSSIQAPLTQNATSQYSNPQGQFFHPSAQDFKPPHPNFPTNAQVQSQISVESQQTYSSKPSDADWTPAQHSSDQRSMYVNQATYQMQSQRPSPYTQLPVSSQQPYQDRNASAQPQSSIGSVSQTSALHYQQPQMNSNATGLSPSVPSGRQGNLNHALQYSQSQNFPPVSNMQYSSRMHVSQAPAALPTLAMSQQANITSQPSSYSTAPSGIVRHQNAPMQYAITQNFQNGIRHHNVPINQGQSHLLNAPQLGAQEGVVRHVAPMRPEMNRMPQNQPVQYASSGNQWSNRMTSAQTGQPQTAQPARFSTQSSVESQKSTDYGLGQPSLHHSQVANHPPTPDNRMHAPSQQSQNIHPPPVTQQYGPTAQQMPRIVPQQQLIRPPVPSSYNQSDMPQATQSQYRPAIADGRNDIYHPRPTPVQNQSSNMNISQSVIPTLNAAQHSPQRSTSNMNVHRFQPPQQNVIHNTPRAANPAIVQQQNVPVTPQASQTYVAAVQPGQRESYTFHSHPHVGSMTSTPSNENSPKHVMKQTVSANEGHQNLGILKPTPVGGSKVPPDSQLPGQSSMDLAGLVLTPRRTLSSSADELLLNASELPAILTKESSKGMLIPTKIDEVDDRMVVRPIEGLPYMDEADLMHFKIQVTEFRSKVSNLLNKPVTVGLCELDREWKQLSESQEKHSRKLSTAIARCSSYKNRYQDIIPFDQSRVVLQAAKDDYINASLIDGVSPYCPRFIAAQSPLSNTTSDFWLMIYEQQVNIIVMLVNSKDVPKRCPVYWPSDRTLPQQHGPLTVSFTTSKTHGDLYIERTFTIKHKNQSLAMSVTQLQYIAWPEHRLPSSANDLLSFLRVVQSYHSSQRNLQWPILVHCESGVGRTGVFCAFVAAVNEINAGMGTPDVVDILTKMRLKRKYMVQEKAQLKFVYDIVLYHAIDVLKQRNVVLIDETKPLTLPAQININHDISHPTSSNFDIFSNQSALSSIQATVEKMTIKPVHEQELSMAESNFASSGEPMSFDDNTNPVSPLPMQATSSHQTYPVQGGTVAWDTNLAASPQTFVEMSDLVQGTISPSSSISQVETTVSLQGNTPNPPDVVESCNNSPAGNIAGSEAAASDTICQYNSAPTASNLMDAMTPESFTLNLEESEKKQRISKADFYKPTTGLNVENDASDPFSGLDPLWGLRK